MGTISESKISASGSGRRRVRGAVFCDGSMPSLAESAVNSVIAKRSVPLSPQGQIQLLFGERDDHSEATITVPSSAVKLPPIPVPGFGTFCVTATANGSGFLDCAGGRAGGNIVLTRDHYTNDVDPTCAVDGSCEEGRTCPGPLPHPHISACPVCIAAPSLGSASTPIRRMLGSRLAP